MIPCYFTLEELKALKSYVEFFQDEYQAWEVPESYDQATLIRELLKGKIQLHK
jgi:hypothetical protein